MFDYRKLIRICNAYIEVSNMCIKKLPINMEADTRSCPQYLFLNTIINNKFTNINEVAKIYINDFDKLDWSHYTRNSKFWIEENNIHFSRIGFDFDSQKCIYRKLSYNDELTFQIKYQQYTNRWDSIIAFIDINNTKERIDNYPQMRLVFGRYCNGDLFIMSGEYYQLQKKEKYSKNEWFKIKVVNGRIFIYLLYDNLEWSLINEVKNFKLTDDNNATIGLECCLLNNQYNKWMSNNFIQLYYNRNNPVKLDYSGLIQRDNRSYSINPFIKFSYIERDVLDSLKIKLIDYILSQLDTNKYIELWLNEKYIPYLAAYDKYDYIHESLIFGYDNKNKVFNLISFLQGKPIQTTVSYDNISKAWESVNDNNRDLTSFAFQPDIEIYELDIFHIYNKISDYLFGHNSSEDYSNAVGIESGIFGINIYKEFISSNCNKRTFLEDVRIAFLLKEHKYCMKKRFEYLNEWGLFPKYEYKKINILMKKITNLSDVILYLVIKNGMVNSILTQNKIWLHLDELCNYEKRCYGLVKAILEVV